MNIVTNWDVYDLEESLRASGYPMRTNLDWDESTSAALQRGERLGHATLNGNQAHNQFTTGIRVNFDLRFSNKAWVEAERYRFFEFVSSQSTMHCITKFDLDEQYNKYVDKEIIDIMKRKIAHYNLLLERQKEASERFLIDEYTKYLKELRLEILYSNPAGFMLTARITTNYRCLRNIWIQRKNHQLPEWREFCKWIETLPYAKELICYTKGEEENETT